MMNCPKCQGANDADAKFCIHCGAKLDLVTEDTARPEESEPSQTEKQPIPENVGTPHPQPQPQPQQVQTNEFVDKTKGIAKNYWAFLLKVFKSPYRTSQEVTDDKPDLINGLITVVLFSLLLPLFIYFYTRNVSGGWFGPTFLDTVVIPLFVFLIVIALVVGIIFAVVRLLKINIDYLAVFTRLATLMVLPTAIALVAIVLSLLKANAVSLILGGIALFITFFASFQTIFSIKETHYQEGGLDLIYVVLINYAAILVIFLLLGDALLGSFLSYFFW